MADVKADLIVYIKQALREKGGDVEKRFVAELSAEALRYYESARCVSWVPVGVSGRMYDQAAALLFSGAADGLRRLGYDCATAGYTSVYRALLRFATIPLVLKQSARIWRTHHTDGDPSVENSTKQSAIFVVRNYAVLPVATREVVAGYILALGNLVGARDVQVRRDDVGPTLQWHIIWR